MKRIRIVAFPRSEVEEFVGGRTRIDMPGEFEVIHAGLESRLGGPDGNDALDGSGPEMPHIELGMGDNSGKFRPFVGSMTRAVAATSSASTTTRRARC